MGMLATTPQTMPITTAIASVDIFLPITTASTIVKVTASATAMCLGPMADGCSLFSM